MSTSGATVEMRSQIGFPIPIPNENPGNSRDLKNVFLLFIQKGLNPYRCIILDSKQIYVYTNQ